MENMLHVGNVLFLIAFSIREMLWLRIITVAAQMCLMGFYYSQTPPLNGPAAWGLLFMGVNIVQIILLLLEKRPVFLGEEELQLYRTVFNTLKPREFVKLLSIAEWKRAKVGDELLQQDKPVPALMLVSSGRGVVEVDGRRVATVTSGQFVGEMGFLTEQHASARVVADTPIDFLAWTAPKLREILFDMPALHVKVQGILGNDLIAKLRHKGVSAAHPSRLMTIIRNAASDAATGPESPSLAGSG